jgi:signal transduction histidine kinase
MEDEPKPAAQQPNGTARRPRRLLEFTSLRTRMVGIIFLALVPAFLLLVGVAALERNRAAANAANDALATARILSDQYEQLIAGAEQLMSLTATYPEIQSGDPAHCSERLQSVFDLTEDSMGLSVAGRDGQSVCIAMGRRVTTTLSLGNNPYYRAATAAEGFAVGGLEIGEISGRPNLTFGYAILDDQGEVERVLGYGVSVDELNRQAIDIRYAEDAVLLMVADDGTVIVRSPNPADFVGKKFDLSQLDLTRSVTEGVQTAMGLDGETRLYGFSTVSNDDDPVFHVLVGYTPARVFGGVDRTLGISVIGLSLIAILALAGAWISAESLIVDPIARIVAVAERMRADDLTARTGMQDEPSELGELATTLDQLAADLAQRRQENLQLLGELRTLNSRLEQRVDQRTAQLVESNERLTSTQAELRRLSLKLMRATEQERTRISREIHDQLGQMITAIKMELRSAQRSLERAGSEPSHTTDQLVGEMERSESKLDAISGMLDEMVVLVRRISADLRPGLLDDFGLEAAVEWQLQEFSKLINVETSLETAIDEERLSPAQATAAFRILQEALTNVARHAEATHVAVQVATHDEMLTLQVQDNGRGISLEGAEQTRSLGLLGMRERAGELGGTVEISGEPGKGVRVLLRLPLDGENGTESPNKQA